MSARSVLAVLLLLAATPACAAAPSPPTASARAPAPVAPARVSVEVVGRGPDLVLIPGLGGSPAVWRDTAARLRKSHRLHLVQVAGFAGAAPPPDATTGPLLAPAADALVAHLRARGVRRVKLVGHSTGGKLALMAALRAPDLVSEVMVVDMLPFFGAVLNPAARGPADVTPAARAVRARTLAADPAAFRAEQSAAIDRFARRPESRAQTLRDVERSDRATYAQAMYELLTTDLRTELPRLPMPVTVLYADGRSVVGFGPHDARALYTAGYAGLRNGRLIPVPDTGHLIMDDQPERFARELDAFLRD